MNKLAENNPAACIAPWPRAAWLCQAEGQAEGQAVVTVVTSHHADNGQPTSSWCHQTCMRCLTNNFLNQTALLHTVLRTSDLFQYLINCGLHFDHSQHLPHVCIWCTHVYYDVDFRMDRNIKIMKCWLLIKSTGFQKHIVQPRPGCADSINKELIHKIFETRHNNGGDMFKTLHQSEEEEEGGKKWCANQQGYWMSSW